MKRILKGIIVITTAISFMSACKKNDESFSESIEEKKEAENLVSVNEFMIDLPKEYEVYFNYGDDKDIYAAFSCFPTMLIIKKDSYESLTAKGYDAINMNRKEYAELWRSFLTNCVMSPEEVLESDDLVYIGYYRIREDSSTSYVTFVYDANEAFWTFQFSCERYSDEEIPYEERYREFLEIAKSVTFK